MKVTLQEHVLPFTSAVATAAGSLARRLVWTVAIADEAGRVGLGEAAPHPYFGGEDPLTCAEVLAQAIPLITEDFLLSWMTRARPDAALGRLETMLAATPCARSAVEGALVDLLAQRNAEPLARTLAGRDTAVVVPVNALIGGDAEDALVERARALIDDGFLTIKLKVGGDPDGDAVRVAMLRGVVGSAVALRVDANAGWDFAAAHAFLTAAGDSRLEFCEQPLDPDDLAGMAKLRKLTGCKLAADESVRRPVDVGRIAAAQAADLIVLKPMFLGGWRPTLQAAQLARSQGLEVVITSALDGAIGRAHATHIAAALGCITRAQGLATGSYLARDLTASPLLPVRGELRLGEAAGLGIGALLAPG